MQLKQLAQINWLHNTIIYVTYSIQINKINTITLLYSIRSLPNELNTTTNLPCHC
jgi:hypothetical protein